MAFPRIEGYVVTEKLGSGSYSTVYKAYNKVGGRMTVAIKCVDKVRVKHSGWAVDNLITEIRLLKSLSHPHIVKMHDFTWDHKNIYIIMEYCSGGDLSKYIRRYGRVPEKQVRYFLQQLVSALKYLYEKGVVHMDLKPHNLLLQRGADARLTLKLADFGFAQHVASSEAWGRAVRGSPLYMAPEMLAGAPGPACDLWSVGVIMYECLFGAAPYSSATLTELLDKIQRREPIKIPAGAAVSAECRALLAALLAAPERRLTHEQLFAHPYLDLAHAPGAASLARAAALVRRAAAADAAGRLPAALAGYTAALRYLLPCVAAETDAVRRAALTHKVTRYMERAEQIKAYLKEQEALTSETLSVTPPDSPRSDRTERTAPEYPAAVTSSAPDAVALPQPPAPASPTAAPGPAPAPDPAPAPEGGVRRKLRKLFGRQDPVPLLDDNDLSIKSGPSQEKPEKESTDNDTCRIT